MSIQSCVSHNQGPVPDRDAAEDVLLTAKQSAELLNVHVVTLWQQVAAGRLPVPVYVAPKAPRWWRSRLIEAVNATGMLPSAAKAERRARRLALADTDLPPAA
jgi:predicted DNA-binding transcriptional regulator AlpA